MSRRNLDEMRGGTDDGQDDGSDELQFGWRSTRRQTSYEHRGSSSLTPAQVMDQPATATANVHGVGSNDGNDDGLRQQQRHRW